MLSTYHRRIAIDFIRIKIFLYFYDKHIFLRCITSLNKLCFNLNILDEQSVHKNENIDANEAIKPPPLRLNTSPDGGVIT